MSLDNLWENVEGLKDLLDIMVPLQKASHADYWVSKLLCIDPSIVTMIGRQIMKEAAMMATIPNIPRFRFYALRIKSLNILPERKSSPPRVHASVLDFLSRSIGGFALPNLDSLTIHTYEDPDVRWLRYIPLFFSARLHKVVISYPEHIDDETRGEANAMAAQMAKSSKMVNNLVIVVPGRQSELFESGVNELVSKLGHLNSLALHGFRRPGPLLSKVAQLKLLKTLQLSTLR